MYVKITVSVKKDFISNSSPLWSYVFSTFLKVYVKKSHVNLERSLVFFSAKCVTPCKQM